MPHIDYFFSTISPFTYLAGNRLEEIAARHGATVTYKPLDIVALFPRTGGTFVQAESETAAINMVLGAAAAGERTMTGSSGPGISLIFIVLASLLATVAFGGSSNTFIVVIAAGFGAYMALNIGANDVANNMGPAVGANALTMGGAIAIAAIFESAGALLAGGDVVSTIAKGIIAQRIATTTAHHHAVASATVATTGSIGGRRGSCIRLAAAAHVHGTTTCHGLWSGRW